VREWARAAPLVVCIAARARHRRADDRDFERAAPRKPNSRAREWACTALLLVFVAARARVSPARPRRCQGATAGRNQK